MKAIEIRNKFLKFFEEHDHKIIPSAPLIPINDPSVLFTTAGMQPLVPYLLGEKHPEGNKLTDYQKCLRTNDIDEVGDNRHLTYFEMLGNWSLGAYFKEEAIKMSFEFLTKVLNIPVDKLSVTCFAGNTDAPKDEEAAKYWEEAGIPKERIFLNEPMSKHTTFKIGGKAKIFIKINSVQELQNLLKIPIILNYKILLDI